MKEKDMDSEVVQPPVKFLQYAKESVVVDARPSFTCQHPCWWTTLTPNPEDFRPVSKPEFLLMWLHKDCAVSSIYRLAKLVHSSLQKGLREQCDVWVRTCAETCWICVTEFGPLNNASFGPENGLLLRVDRGPRMWGIMRRLLSGRGP
jgi:hypothetical protein